MLAPLAAGEAVWIGLLAEPDNPRLAVDIRLDRAGASPGVRMSLLIEGPTAVTLVPIGDGRQIPILRQASQAAHAEFQGIAVSLGDRPEPAKPDERSGASADIRFVDYDTFVRHTGSPAPHPLDPDAAYRGDLLP